MKIVVHDTNTELREKVRLGFKLTTENKENGWYKYNGTEGEIFGNFNQSYNEQVMKCLSDESIQYFRGQHFVKMDSPLNPGEKVVCCQDKECPDKPVDKKQTFIFCPECSKDTYNFTICLQHASEYEDAEAMIEEEKRLDQLKNEQWDKDKATKLKVMILFLVLDESDDGYVQVDEWMELYKCIVLKKPDPKKKAKE